MKKAIHPNYQTATISCACGATYKIGSTLESVSVELCSACHPFYTGTQKIIDTARRVEKFAARATKKQEGVKNLATKKKERAAKRKPKFDVETTSSGRVKKAA